MAGNDANLAAMPGAKPACYRALALSAGRAGGRELRPAGHRRDRRHGTAHRKANPAANNLLGEHHIVLVDGAARLVANHEQAWAGLRQEMDRGGRPRGLGFIAGPSSTADIEASWYTAPTARATGTSSWWATRRPRCWRKPAGWRAPEVLQRGVAVFLPAQRYLEHQAALGDGEYRQSPAITALGGGRVVATAAGGGGQAAGGNWPRHSRQRLSPLPWPGR